jgi:N utilization substance protein B
MNRRGAREAAMRIMYSMEYSANSSGLNGEQSAKDYWTAHKVSDQMRDYAMSIVNGVEKKKAEIDSLITEASENWTLDRMAAVDRNILRIAAYELLERQDVPPAVVVDEALEIAKRYSDQESVAFINGILGKLAKDAAQNGK